MKLTSRSEYALLALIFLARDTTDEYVSAETIAVARDIPLKYLEQILLALTRAKYLKSSKGKHGGYRLARPATKITLAEVIRLFDGALAPTESVSRYYYEATPIAKERELVKVFKEIRDYVSDTLEQTTIKDVT